MVAALLAVTLTAAPVQVHARVVDGHGPVQGARVSVWDSTFALDGVPVDADGVARIWTPEVAQSGADGETSFDVSASSGRGFSSGDRRAVLVTARGHVATFGVYEVANGHIEVGEVRLPPAGDVRVRVLCDRRRCKTPVTVQFALGRDMRTAEVDAQGFAQLWDVAEGDATVRAEVNRGVQGERVGTASFHVTVGRTNDVTLELARTGASLEVSGRGGSARESGGPGGHRVRRGEPNRVVIGRGRRLLSEGPARRGVRALRVGAACVRGARVHPPRHRPRAPSEARRRAHAPESRGESAAAARRLIITPGADVGLKRADVTASANGRARENGFILRVLCV